MNERNQNTTTVNNSLPNKRDWIKLSSEIVFLKAILRSLEGVAGFIKNRIQYLEKIK